MFHASYRAFGLTIDSEIELPELPRARIGAAADVTIRLGDALQTLPGGQPVEAGVSAKPGTMLIDNDIARFLVRGGDDILLELKPGASTRDARAYLLGSIMGAVLHQRRLLPLHANAVVIDGRAVAFSGASGTGKSTLAAHFRSQGRAVLSDDVCVITFDRDGQALAWPGIPRIKLWGDALAAFGRTAGDLERVLDGQDKFSLPFPPHPLARPVRLSRIYMITRAPPEEIAGTVWPLNGAGAYAAINANIYRREFAAPLGTAAALFANVVSLLNCTQVFQISRRWGFDVFGEEVATIESHLNHARAPQTGFASS